MLRGYVYILCNRKNGTLYIGVTKDLPSRLREHKSHANPDSFTARYDVSRLVYYEVFERLTDALDREKQLKNWKRSWKIALIEEHNPDWNEIEIDMRDIW